jgi:FtsP/CotA-like multicopper oxidase with cupredoxin domain
MKEHDNSRRSFLKTAGLAAGAALVPRNILAQSGATALSPSSSESVQESGPVDYTLHIKVVPVEIAPKRIVSATTYNGQFPGPLLRFQEGKPVTIEIYNDTDVPEQLHWHGQKVSTDVDGASEEGTPYIPARGKRPSLLSHS